MYTYTCLHTYIRIHIPLHKFPCWPIFTLARVWPPPEGPSPLNRKQRVSLEAAAWGARLLLLPALPSTAGRHTLDPDFYPADVSRTFTPVVWGLFLYTFSYNKHWQKKKQIQAAEHCPLFLHLSIYIYVFFNLFSISVVLQAHRREKTQMGQSRQCQSRARETSHRAGDF